MSALNRYNENLANPRAPGIGDNCHTWLLSTANYGVMAKIDPHKIFDDLRKAILPGKRPVLDKEIKEAINKALSDLRGGTFIPRARPAPIVNDGKTALQRIIRQGKISNEVDLLESSPVRVGAEPKEHHALFLSTIFNPSDYIWIGGPHQVGIMGDTIKTARAWIDYFKNGGTTAPHVIINPLTGTPALKKSGDGETLRGDGNIKQYLNCMVEFDTLSREDQIRFWSAVKLPIVALIDSGGKSIHAWLQVSKLAAVTTSGQWQSEIKSLLYDRRLTPLGVDAACSNPARLSRLPGHYRKEKENYQRLLWLSPEGRAI